MVTGLALVCALGQAWGLTMLSLHEVFAQLAETSTRLSERASDVMSENALVRWSEPALAHELVNVLATVVASVPVLLVSAHNYGRPQQFHLACQLGKPCIVHHLHRVEIVPVSTEHTRPCLFAAVHGRARMQYTRLQPRRCIYMSARHWCISSKWFVRE